MASKSARSKRQQQQQQLPPHAPLEDIVNAPLRVYPPDAFRASAVAASPLMQMLQSVSTPVPVVGFLSTSYDSPERALAFANRIIGKYAFRAIDLSPPKDAAAAAPLLASVYLYYDASRPCVYLLGVVRPESECFDRNATDADIAAFERERFNVQLLLHTSCSLLFVLHEHTRVPSTLLRDVRALAAEKQQLQSFVSSNTVNSAKSNTGKKSSNASAMASSTSLFTPGRCVPLVLFVVPASDDAAILDTVSSTSKTKSTTGAFCKAYEAKLVALLRSVRGGVVGSCRMRDALTAANLSKDRRLCTIDPTHCAVVVSSHTAGASGRLDAKLDDLLESLDPVVSSTDSIDRSPLDLRSLLAPLDDDDVGFPRAIQFVQRCIDMLLTAASSSSSSSSSSSKDVVRVEVLTLSHWLRAFHALVKALQRMDIKRRQDAAAAAASDSQLFQHQLHAFSSIE